MLQALQASIDRIPSTRSPHQCNTTGPAHPPPCEGCCVGTLCLLGGLDEDDLRPLASLSMTTRRFVAGETIYAQGTPFRYVYAVRCGTCKTTMTRSDGGQHVAGFHLAGDFMGLEGLADGVHHTTSVALEDTQLCLIPYARLQAVTAEYPGAKDLIAHVMSREIAHHSDLLMLLAMASAPQRLAAFLLDLSARYAQRGWSPREFRLRMTRADIGSFLGMTLETVSRTLSMFARSGYIECGGREIRMLEPAALRRKFDVRMH